VNRVKALFFDFDGTLLDGSGHREAIWATCREIASAHSDLDADRLLETNGEVWTHYWPTVVQGWTLGRLDGATIRREAWKRTLEACGCDDPAVARTASAAHARHLRESLRLYPEVLALLPSLRLRYRLALISNGASDTQRESLRMLGIEQVFDAVAISGEVGVAKPDAAIFQIALRDLGVRPEQAWHIGDDALTDIAGAHAAGLTAVWLNRSESLWIHGEPQPHYEVSSLSELPKLLRPEDSGASEIAGP
jgi:2-haloalkanoic acid dehalogenase type II